MTIKRTVVKAEELSAEDLYFQEQDKKKIGELKTKSNRDANDAYRDAHRNHCFRCGTASLVEVDYSSIHIDICVNDDCGAVHLDPGEMEKILEGEKGLFFKVKASISSAFK